MDKIVLPVHIKKLTSLHSMKIVHVTYNPRNYDIVHVELINVSCSMLFVIIIGPIWHASR